MSMSASPGLRFSGFVVPESDLEWSFDTPGGPGGQHANRNSTRVTLSFDLEGTIAVPDAVKQRLSHRLGARYRNGTVTVAADDSRSQWRNRAIARSRLETLLEHALIPERTRRATTPSRSARRKRLEEKRLRSETKRLRDRPESDE
jgi:ribosome-associated protein